MIQSPFSKKENKSCMQLHQMSYLQNCVRHLFEMKSKTLQFFWRLFQKLFGMTTWISKAKTKLRFMGNGGGQSAPALCAGPLMGARLHSSWNEVSFLLWKFMWARQKSFWNSLQKLKRFWFHLKPVTFAILKVWLSFIFAKLRTSLVWNEIKHVQWYRWVSAFAYLGV